MQKDMQVVVTLAGVDKLNPKLKDAIGRVNDLTSKAQVAKARLKDIAITDNQLRGYERLRTEVIGASRALQQAKDKARELGELSKRTAFATEPYQKAQAEVKKLAAEYERLKDKAQRANEVLTGKGMGGTAATIAAHRARLEAEQKAMLTVIERQERMQEARARADNMRSRAGTLAGVGVSMLAPGYAISRGLGAATADASAYNSELRQIALTADMSDARMRALGQTIIRTSDQVYQSTANLTSGIGFLIAAGMSEDLAQRSINTIGKVATAYKADILEVSQASFVLNDSLGIIPEKMQGAIGIMARAGKEGNVELRDMAKTLPVLGSGMVALKMQGNEAVATMAAALQIARKGAPTADIAANNMQNFLAKVMSPETLKKATEKFDLDLYGVITNAQAQGKNPLEAAIEAISRVTKGGDQKLLGDLFGDMQVQSFLRPMLQNMDEYRRIKGEALAAASGTMIDEDFARVANDMDVSTGRLGNAWNNLKIMVGNALAPALGPVISMLASATTGLVNFADRHPKLISVLAILAGILGTVLIAGGGIALLIAGILVPMAALTVAAAALGIGLAPLLLILAGIAAAVAAVVAVFVYWDEIVGYFQGKWQQLKTELSTVGQFFLSVGKAILTGLIQPILEGGSQLISAITGLVSQGVQAAKNVLGIRSPSRVFTEIGAHTTAGLSLGIQRGTPAAVDTVRRMAAGITVAGAATLTPGMAMAAPGGSGAMGGAAAGGVTIGQVSIVIEGSGLDADAIARAVDQRLRQMATQARTDAQSRFFDDN